MENTLLNHLLDVTPITDIYTIAQYNNDLMNLCVERLHILNIDSLKSFNKDIRHRFKYISTVMSYNKINELKDSFEEGTIFNNKYIKKGDIIRSIPVIHVTYKEPVQVLDNMQTPYIIKFNGTKLRFLNYGKKFLHNFKNMLYRNIEYIDDDNMEQLSLQFGNTIDLYILVNDIPIIFEIGLRSYKHNFDITYLNSIKSHCKYNLLDPVYIEGLDLSYIKHMITYDLEANVNITHLTDLMTIKGQHNLSSKIIITSDVEKQVYLYFDQVRNFEQSSVNTIALTEYCILIKFIQKGYISFYDSHNY